MDKTVTVGSPTLNPGDSFEVRYRLLPGGAWQDFGLVNTNTFTITGLVDGTYELEVSYVFEGGQECPPVVTTFVVDTNPPVIDCECLDLTNVYVNKDCENIITINATIATPYPENCGVRITYSYNGGSDIVANYTNTNLPSNLQIPVQSTNNVKLKVEVLCCATEQWMVCYDSIIVDVRRCDCISPPEIINETYTININNTRTYCVTFNPSNPNTPPYTITLYPDIVLPLNYVQVVPGAGTYCFQMPENVNMSRGKWLCIVSNQCGQDQSNGL